MPVLVIAQEQAVKPIIYGPGIEIAQLAKPDINESSGIAASRTNPGVFYTHNDSGDSPRFFAFNEKGEDVGTFMVSGAKAIDWEDMTSFSFEQRNFVLLADIGDNFTVHKSRTLYLVVEPIIETGHAKTDITVPLAASIEFSYEDGAQNSESVFVDTVSKQIFLVSKTTTNVCAVYALPLVVSGQSEKMVAKRLASLNIPITTGGDLSAHRDRAIITTYKHAYEYVRSPMQDWTEAFSQPPRVIALPTRKQGEAICYGLDGKTLYLTSEKLPCPLIKLTPVE